MPHCEVWCHRTSHSGKDPLSERAKLPCGDRSIVVLKNLREETDGTCLDPGGSTGFGLTNDFARSPFAQEIRLIERREIRWGKPLANRGQDRASASFNGESDSSVRSCARCGPGAPIMG